MSAANTPSKPGPQLAGAAGSVLLRLLTAASLMRITITERATFLTKTTDWERLEDAMQAAELELEAPNAKDEARREATLPRSTGSA